LARSDFSERAGVRIEVKEAHMTHTSYTPPAGWSVEDWSRATSIGRTKVFELIQRKAIQSVAFGRRRIITTAPDAFLASLATEARDAA
jgi:hypothetical protein